MTEGKFHLLTPSSIPAYSTIVYFVHDGIPNDQGGYDPGWVDDYGFDIQEAGIPAGSGFWFVNNDKEFTATYKK